MTTPASTDAEVRRSELLRVTLGLLLVGASVALAAGQLALVDLSSFAPGNVLAPGRRIALLAVTGAGVALAALAGVLAAPIYQVSPLMGRDMIITVFAVVVIGGMGSIMGAIVSGFALGVVEGLTKVFYPEASSTVIFVIMALVLLVKPAGIFGQIR